jgi:multiple sugar transport system substrate-binding protein
VQETTVVEKGVETAVPATSPPVEEVTLRIVHNWGESTPKGPPLYSIFSDFMEAYPHITIEDEVFTDEDIPTRVETAFMAGEEPDMVFQNLMSQSREWTENGLTIPVDDLLTEWNLKDVLLESAVADFVNPQGLTSAFPLEGFVWPIWYNTQILKEAGVEIPMTIDELIAAADKILAAGYQPLVVPGGEGAVQALGLILVSLVEWPKTRQLYTEGGFSGDPDGVAGVELFVKLRDAGVFAEDTAGLDWPLAAERFYTGRAAMAHLGSWNFSEAPSELLDHIALGGFPLPPDSPLDKPVIFGAFVAKGVWITRNGAEKLTAIEEFVRFLYQPEMIARFVEQASMIPPLKGLSVDESKVSPLFLQALGLGEKVTISLPVGSVVPGSVRSTLMTNVGPLMSVPGTTVEEILLAMDEAYAGAE